MLKTLSIAVAATLAALASADFPTDLSNVLRSGRPSGASLGVSVRDLSSGKETFRLDADRPLLPASNMKLLTTGAAIVSLGVDFRFRTTMRLVARGEAREIHVVGDGDPSFADPDLLAYVTWTRGDGTVQTKLDATAFLDAWARSVVEARVGRVSAVVADPRIFDRAGFHPLWPEKQFPERYCAEVHGLNFHHNLLAVRVAPVTGGKASIVELSPKYSFLPISNRTTSNRSAAAKHSFWIGRGFTDNEITLNGNVQVETGDPVAITVHDTPSLLAELLATRLRAAGIEVGGSRVATDAEPRGVGTSIGPPVETPLSTVLLRCNTDSDNLAAECLLKRVVHKETGQPGSWTAAASVLPEVIARKLGDAGSTRGLVISDGSGLSRGNRVTASLMTRWIAALDGNPATAAVFRESLAVGGDTGTVKNRFKSLARTGCTVLCKTGFINGVSCLSGIVVGPDGRSMAFSILGNDLTAANAIGKAKELQERIVLEIAEELGRTRAALGG